MIETHGERIATTGERWALAYGDWVRLYDGTEPAGELPPAPEHVYDLRYDGDVLLAAPSRAAGDAWEELPPLGRAIDPWRVVTATWAGEQLLVVAVRALGRPRAARPPLRRPHPRARRRALGRQRVDARRGRRPRAPGGSPRPRSRSASGTRRGAICWSCRSAACRSAACCSPART